MEFRVLLWWSLCAGLTEEVNLSQTMPRFISLNVNSLTLSISVSLWAGTTLTDIMERLTLGAVIERRTVIRHACSSVWDKESVTLKTISLWFVHRRRTFARFQSSLKCVTDILAPDWVWRTSLVGRVEGRKWKGMRPKGRGWQTRNWILKTKRWKISPITIGRGTCMVNFGTPSAPH